MESRKFLGFEPSWVWPRSEGLDTIRLSYPYKDLDEIWTLNNLRHLAAVNDIRLQTNGDWMSQRQLFQEIIGEDEFESPHQPDAELRLPDGGIIAVKVQMRLKPLVDLEKTLIGLLQQSQYTQIWYFAEPSVRKQVRRVCAQLVQQRDLSIEEADHLLIKWYPLALTEEDRQKQELEALACTTVALLSRTIKKKKRKKTS